LRAQSPSRSFIFEEVAVADEVYQWTNVLPNVLWPGFLYTLNNDLWKKITRCFDVETYKAVRLTSTLFRKIVSVEDERIKAGMMEDVVWVDKESLKANYWGGQVLLRRVAPIKDGNLDSAAHVHPLLEGLQCFSRELVFKQSQERDLHAPLEINSSSTPVYGPISFENLIRPFTVPADIEGFRDATLEAHVR
jgi:hypothetical protein